MPDDQITYYLLIGHLANKKVYTWSVFICFSASFYIVHDRYIIYNFVHHKRNGSTITKL